MKKNRFAIILLLFVVLSYPVFSDQDTCRGTSEYASGVQNAKAKSYGLLWSPVGFGLPVIGMLGSGYCKNAVDGIFTNPYFFFLLPAIGTGVSLALPLVKKPEPKTIPDSIPEDRRDCYIEGYSREARRRSINGALVGSGVFWGWVGLMVFLYGF